MKSIFFVKVIVYLSNLRLRKNKEFFFLSLLKRMSKVVVEKYLSDPSDVNYGEDESITRRSSQLKHKHADTRTEPELVYFGVGELSQTMVKSRTERARKYKGVSITPNDISAAALDKELKAFTDITSEQRNDWRKEMASLPQIQYMNKKILAATLVLIHNLGENFTPDDFNIQADNVLNKLMVPAPSPDSPSAKKYKATLFRYMKAVNYYRS